MKRFLFAFFIFFALVSHYCSAQFETTKGKTYWLGFMQNSNGQYNGPEERMSVFISSNKTTSGTVSVPLQGWIRDFTVNAGTTVEISLPNNISFVGSDRIRRFGVLVNAQDTINVYALNYKRNSADASVILPINTLRSEYTLMSYAEGVGGGSSNSEFMIVATEDNTQIEISPTNEIINRGDANPYTITINRGEVYQAQSENDLTGTLIRSVRDNCKPFAVFGGNTCTNIGNCGRCDHIFEQIFPNITLGFNYLSVPLKNRTSDLIRVMATEFQTTIRVNGQAPFILNRGEYRDMSMSAPANIQSDKPIMVAQFTKGGCCEPNVDCFDDASIYSDPDMLLISPIEQMTITSATVSSFFIDNIKDSFINVITKTANTGLVTRNGVNISSQFRPVPSNPIYSYAQLEVPKGNHTIRSDSGFIAYVYGFGERDSYSYSGDVMLSNITLTIEGPREICVGSPAIFKGTALGSVSDWRWNFGDGTRVNGQNPPPHIFREAGTYRIMLEARSSDGRCGFDSTFKEIRVYKPRLRIEDQKNIPCGTNENGSFRVIATSGKAPYIFRLLGTTPIQNTDGVFSVSQPGRYQVRVNDALGCSDTIVVNIAHSGSLTVSISKTDDVCSSKTGSATATVSGGKPPLTYRWSDGSVTPTISNLAEGSYSVTVTDADNCSGISEITILNRGSEITVELVGATPAECGQKNGTLEVTAKGGNLPYTFIWSNGFRGANPTGLEPASYSVTVSDQLGCTTTANFNVQGKDAPRIILSQTGNITICEGNTTTLSATIENMGPDGTLQWHMNGVPITGANQRSIIIDQGGEYVLFAIEPPCTTSSNPVTVISPIIPDPVLTTQRTDICAGEVAIISVTPVSGANYTWTLDGIVVSSGVTPNYTASLSGTVVCTTEIAGCKKISNSLDVKVYPKPEAVLTIDGNLNLCNGETSTLRVANCLQDVSYTWKKDGVALPQANSCQLEVNETGNYTFTAVITHFSTDGKPIITCEQESNTIQIVSLNTSGNIVQAATAPIVCEGKPVELFTTNNPEYSYQWLFNNLPIPSATTHQLVANQAGRYSVRITSGSCTFMTNPYTVVTFPISTVTLSKVDNTCAARPLGRITAQVSGGVPPYRYRWSNGGTMPTITGIGIGTYNVTVTDQNGCAVISEPISITEPPRLVVQIDSIKNASCSSDLRGSVFVSATGGVAPYTFIWSNGSRTQNLIEVRGGRYSLFVRDAAGCSQILDNINLSEPQSMVPFAQTITPVRCYGDTTGGIIASVQGGLPPYAFALNDNNFTTNNQFINIRSGIYTLFVKDATGCVVSRSVEIGQSDSITINSRVKDVTCGASADGSVELAARGGEQPYLFSLKSAFGEGRLTNSHGVFNWLAPGKYLATIKDRLGCEKVSDTIIIRVNQGSAPTIEFNTVGDALKQDSLCYTLTEAKEFQTSALWNRQQINLFKGFDFSFDLNFGNDDNGADGMVFVLQDIGINAIGFRGSGIGYQGMDRSFGIEFDTHYNVEVRGDIPCDHIAYFANGITDEPLAGVVPASATDCNIEDGATHRVRIRWDPVNKVIETYFDNEPRMRDTIDLVNTIFKGKPTVYWGFTSATGAMFNEHTYCVTDAQIICDCNNFKPAILPVGTTEICQNDFVTFSAPPGFRKYLWSTGDTTQTLRVDKSGSYYVNVSDENGCGGNSDISHVVVHPRPSFTLASIRHVTFGDGNDGEIILNPSGGTPPYLFRMPGRNWQAEPAFLKVEADTYRVEIKDAKDCAYGAWITVTEPPKFCKKPRNVQVTALTDTSAKITWEKPDNRHATAYLLTWRRIGSNIIDKVRIDNPNTLTYTINGLSAGFTYEVQMRSFCDTLTSLYTIELQFTTPIICYPPVVIKTQPLQNGIRVSWSKANFAHKYVVAHIPFGGGTWKTDTVPSENLGHLITNLVTKTNYLVKVRTICQFGTSFWGDSVVVFTGSEPICTTPTNIRHTVLGLEDCRIEWNAVTDAQIYEVTYRELGTVDWISVKTDSLVKTLTNLMPGTTIQYRVRSICGEDLVSMPSQIRIFTLPDENCKRPKEIYVSPDTNQIYVVWSRVPNVLSYQIGWRKKNSTEPWRTLQINNPNQTQFKINNLESGEEYEVRIRSRCSGNENSTWNDIEVTTIYFGNDACRTPKDWKATDVRGTRATLSWSAIGNAQQYLVRYRRSESSVWDSLTTRSNTITLTGLVQSTVYMYDIQAVCSETERSTPVRSQTFTTLEECPMTTNIEFVNYPNSIKVTWDLIVNAKGYRVFWREKGSVASFDSVTIAPISTNSHLIENTKPNTGYEVRVVTICQKTLSEARTAFTTTPDDCPTPTGLTVQVISENVIQVNWTRVAKAVGYRFRVKPVNGTGDWAVFETPFNNYTLSGLTAATEYNAEVIAICANSIPSSPSVSTRFKTLGTCTPTANVTVTPSITNARVSWDLVLTAQEYIVNWRKRGTNDVWQTATITDKTTNSYLMTGLQAGTAYDVQVAVRCSEGVSGWASNTFVTLSTGGGTACNPPTGMFISSIKPQEAVISWSKVALAQSYQVRYRKSGETSWTEFSVGDTFALLTNLSPNLFYVYQIRTLCTDNRQSIYSSLESFRTPNVCPTVTGITVVPTVNTGVISWDVVPNATGYQIAWRSLEDNQGFTIAEIHNGNQNRYTIPNLNSDMLYQVRIMVKCAETNSAFSSQSFKTLVRPTSCQAPSDVVTTRITATTITLSWSPVAGASSYEVNFRPSDSQNWNAVATPNTTITITDLALVTTYQFRFRSLCNDNTLSNFSSEIAFRTSNDCAVPQNLLVSSIKATAALVTWRNMPNTLNTILAYRLTNSNVWTQETLNGGIASFALTGLRSGSTYEVRIMANCSDFSSDWSSTVNFRTLVGKYAEENGVTANVINIYPNPNKGTFEIRITETESSELTLKLVDALGKTVWMEKAQTHEGILNYTVSVPDLTKGIYLLEVQDGNRRTTQKVMID